MNPRPGRPLVIDSPLIVFGGPYSNLQALDALIDEARRRGIDAAHMISTGDLVAYCADARGVVARVRDLGVRFIRGNCEDQIAAGAGDCGCGFAPGGECDRLSTDWFSHAMRELDEADRAFLGAAPERLDIVMNGLRLAVIHGAATQQNRFVFASTPDRVKAHDFDLLGADVVVAGHSGLPFTQTIGGRLWHNAGALGMPANEGAPRVWYSVIAPGAAPGTLAIEHCVLHYDHAAAAAAMARAGLRPEYARTLVDGFWPNCDSLPASEAAGQGRALTPARLTFSTSTPCVWPATEALAPPRVEGSGDEPATVDLLALDTLWINTGSLCNLACASCYLESTPRNDALAYFTASDAAAFFDEIERERLGVRTIGFTGGEPFLNPQLPDMLADALDRGFDVLALTNAMKPMRRWERALLALREAHGSRLALRVSVDHYARDLHELERGPRSFAPTLAGLAWLVRENFATTVAGRLYSGEPEGIVRGGYARLFADLGLALDAWDPATLVLFPEMDEQAAAAPLTEAIWGTTGKEKADVMCATQRMVLKRKGAERPSVVACTLLPYAAEFELGASLAEARRRVELTHAHCSAFCLVGGADCSS